MSDCSCVYVDSYDSQPEFYNEKMPIARKQHICGECGRKIERGEPYENFSGKWEDTFSTYKTCNNCLSIRDEFFCEGWSFGFLYENLWEHIREIDGQISGECILSLTLGAKETVLDMIDRLWEESEEEMDANTD